MILLKKLFLLLCLLILSMYSFANDSSQITFILDKRLPDDRFAITVHDGIVEHAVQFKNTNYWSGELNVQWGYIEINYRTSDSTVTTRKLFFNKGFNEIHLTYLPDSSGYFDIDRNSSKNIIFYEDIGGSLLDAFTKNEDQALKYFVLKNRRKLSSDRELLQKATMLVNSVAKKQFEFVKLYPDLYVSFWLFESRLVKTQYSPDSLMLFYNTVFSDKFKQSKAAKQLYAVLENKVALNSNAKFPDFQAVDTKGNTIKSSALTGKYVLVQFWASWCIPCIQEIPVLKELNKKYDSALFKIISFSIDESADLFKKAVKKYEMNWTQVYGDRRLYNALGIIPIPQLYLIDKTGNTIYNSVKVNDPDLMILKRILAKTVKLFQ